MNPKYSIARYTNPEFKEAAIKPIQDPTIADTHFIWDDKMLTDDKLKIQIKRSKRAYEVEGTIRNAIDRFSDTQSGFLLKGDTRIVSYLENRLNEMALKTGEDWQTIVARCWHEFWKTGNGMILKYREDAQKVVRPLYRNTPNPISALFLVDITDFTYNTIEVQGNKIPAWTLDDRSTEFSAVSSSPLVLPIRGALINDPVFESTTDLLPGRDVVQFAYKQPPNSAYGIGIVMSALDPSLILRKTEQSVVMMIRKSINPLIHHKVLGPFFGSGGTMQNAIDREVSNHRNRPADAVFVTGPGHEISAIGYESQALRVGEYLKHQVLRLTSTLCSSPFELGFEKGGVNDAEGAQALRHSKVLSARAEFSRKFEKFIFWEILHEGGYDPYKNKDHRVELVFVETDQSIVSKRQNHYADLWQKNAITWDELRTVIPEFDPQTDETRLFANMIEMKQLEKEGEIQKSIAAARPASLSAPSSPKPRSSNSNQAAEFDGITFRDVTYIRNLTPNALPDIETRLEMLSEYFEKDLMGLKTQMKELMESFTEDPVALEEAYVELIKSQIQ